ncbi:terminase family protein [Accumulibacter sp.]|uniref:terminase large subunit domain-containing protein n=1 Tax=Accumulibacter sp. TaxID=2053492 RepID=UPI0026245CD2|nr:terminase family protein [Accumulibacter sp.]
MIPPIHDPAALREARTPMALLPYQQRWVKDAASVKVIEKSRRIGLSWGEAADTALLAARQSGMNAFYIGYMKEMAQEFIRDCAEFAKAYTLAADEISEAEEVWQEGEEKKSIFIYTLRFQSGWRIEALSSAPRNLRGKQGRVILDEYAFHNDQQELLKAALALLIWGGQVHVISTHNGVDNPFNALCQDIRAGKKPYALHRVTFQDAVDAGLYERVCLRTGQPPSAAGQAAWVRGIYDQYGGDAEEELDCVPSNSGGAWLSRALIEARMVDAPVLRWKPPAKDYALWPEHLRSAEMRDWLDTHARPLLATLDPSLRSGFGMDFGRSGDLSVLLPYQIIQALRRRFPFALELSNCPFDQQREALYTIGDGLPRLSAGKLDARGNGQYLAEKAVQKWGAARIEAVMLSLAWYRDHTAPFKAGLEDATIELVRDADHLDDLRAFQVVKGIPLLPDSRSKGQDGSQRHGDAGVAYLLAYAASRSDATAVTSGFESVPKRGRRDDDRDTRNPSRRMF